MSIFPQRYVPISLRRRAQPVWVWEGYGHQLRRILAAGGFSIHDVMNDARVRQAVREQWLVFRRYERDRDIEATIAYLEAQMSS